MNLAQHTILSCAPNLGLRLDSSNQVRILIGDNSVTCGPHSLLVLDAFAGPRPLGEGLAEMRNRVVGMQDWIDLTTVVGQLYQAGVLRAEDQIPERWPDISEYTSIEETLVAYCDTERGMSILHAIRETVRPGDVVLDIEGGPGIFAIASAQAGAGVVYSIANSSYTALAQAAFDANNLADRITLWSSLPSLEGKTTPADVLIADVTLSDLLFDEHLHASLRAQQGLLKTDARAIPRQLCLWALPVTIPVDELQRQTFTADVVGNWRSWYGVDFSPFVDVAANSALLYPLRLHEARDWPMLAEPVALVQTAPLKLDALPSSVTTSFSTTAAGLLNGVVLYMDIEYSSSVKLSAHPNQIAPTSSYHGFYWVLDRPIAVQPGDQLALSYGRAPISNDIWISVSCI